MISPAGFKRSQPLRHEPDENAQVDLIEPLFPSATKALQPHRRWEPVAVVRNTSGLPIFDLGVVFTRSDFTVDGTIENRVDFTSAPVVAPGGEIRFHAKPHLLQPPNYGSAEDAFTVELSFRDAGNRSWYRSHDGRLTPEAERRPRRVGAAATPSPDVP